jgi:hypothetical protein
MDDGVERAWHGGEMGSKPANGSAILALPALPLLKRRIVDSLGLRAFHGIKQPTLFLERLE